MVFQGSSEKNLKCAKRVFRGFSKIQYITIQQVVALGLGFRAWGIGFKVQGLEIKVQGFGLKV